MKKISLYSFILALFIVACGNEKPLNVDHIGLDAILASGNLDSIVAKKEQLYAQQKTLSEQIKQLNDKIAQLDSESKFPLVPTIETTPQVFDHFIELQGNVTTKNLVVITAEFSGLLTTVYVKEGDKVKKGQILGRIDDGGLSQQLTQMEIQTKLAKTTYERQQRLWEQNIGSEIQFLQAQSNYEAQAEAVKQMKQQVAKTRVTAPFSGTIDEVIAQQGNNVGPGSALMRIVNLDNMYIEADVPERFVADVTKGKSVNIEIPVLGKSMTSTVRQAGNFINDANRTFQIEVPVPEQNNLIKPNLTAKLKINDYSNRESILIPQNIISENAEGEQYVYGVSNINNQTGEVLRYIITTGKTQGDVIEVTSGLSKGIQLIKEGARSVKEGQLVKIDTL